MRGRHVLLLVATGTLSGIWWIHHGQAIERQVCRNVLEQSPDGQVLPCMQPPQRRALQNLHQGVLRDDELYALKKAQHDLKKLQQLEDDQGARQRP